MFLLVAPGCSCFFFFIFFFFFFFLYHQNNLCWRQWVEPPQSFTKYGQGCHGCTCSGHCSAKSPTHCTKFWRVSWGGEEKKSEEWSRAISGQRSNTESHFLKNYFTSLSHTSSPTSSSVMWSHLVLSGGKSKKKKETHPAFLISQLLQDHSRVQVQLSSGHSGFTWTGVCCLSAFISL